MFKMGYINAKSCHIYRQSKYINSRCRYHWYEVKITQKKNEGGLVHIGYNYPKKLKRMHKV
jgi:hypothetical protein